MKNETLIDSKGGKFTGEVKNGQLTDKELYYSQMETNTLENLKMEIHTEKEI